MLRRAKDLFYVSSISKSSYNSCFSMTARKKLTQVCPTDPFMRTAAGPAVSHLLLILLAYFFPSEVFGNNMSFLQTALCLSQPISSISVFICVSNHAL